MRTVLAVDGGNSKTDVALVAEDGELLATARGGPFEPHRLGVAAAVEVVAATGLARADHVAAYVAGADLPVEEDRLRAEFAARGLGRTVEVGNDTFALLRAGASAGWGVAVVCGAGINCVGVGPDGRTARFPAIGRISGDWGGGEQLGEEALWHAVRGEDGRGPDTALRAAVAGHFGRARVEEVTVGLHLGEIPHRRLHELVPLLFEVAAAGDPVAISIAKRQAEEIVALGVVALRRLGLLDTTAEVVLGGGVLTARPPVLMAAIEDRFTAHAPRATLVVTEVPLVVGAALLGLDHLGAPESAKARLRAQFTGPG